MHIAQTLYFGDGHPFPDERLFQIGDFGGARSRNPARSPL